jgi:hypothetical protein
MLPGTAVAADMSERIPFIIKQQKGGQRYAFSTSKFFDWSPSLLLANLQEEDLRLVVHGPAGTSGGIVKCFCSAMDGHYDHKREHAEKHNQMTWKRADKSKQFEIWDFIFHRDDNSSCWLHPNFGDNKVEYGEGTAVAAISGWKLQQPTSGPGCSGWKFFKYYKTTRVDKILKLDRSKNIIKTRDAGEWMAP